MIISNNQIGDLGWGWRSAGRGFKKFGAGAYNIAKMPAAMAVRVANSTTSVLCDKSGNPRANDPTSVNYCRSVRTKNETTLRRYLPAAATMASKVAAVRTAYQQPATAPVDGFAGACDPAGRAMKLWRGPDGKVTWAFATAKDVKARKACDVSSAEEYAEGRGFGDPDMNLLASLDGADLGDLSYALAGVTPVDIGGVTTSDAVLFVPALIAVAAGFWMALRG